MSIVCGGVSFTEIKADGGHLLDSSTAGLVRSILLPLKGACYIRLMNQEADVAM